MMTISIEQFWPIITFVFTVGVQYAMFMNLKARLSEVERELKEQDVSINELYRTHAKSEVILEEVRREIKHTNENFEKSLSQMTLRFDALAKELREMYKR